MENRLWTSNPDSLVTSLGWRPDGRVLVSGHADGSVQLHHIEDGEVLHASRPHAAAVTSLHWQQAPAADAVLSSCAYQSVVARFALPIAGGAGGGAGRGGAPGGGRGGGGGGGAAAGGAGAKKDAGGAGDGAGSRALFDHFNPPTRLTVLCSGDARGSVVLSAFGTFPVGAADLARAGLVRASPDIAVQHASLSPDLSRVLVAFSATGAASPASTPPSVAVSAHAATAAVPLLATWSREMCQIAVHGSQVTRLMSGMEAELAAADKNWAKAWGDFDVKMGALHARLIAGWETSEEGDGGAPPTLEDHFAALLATGAVDDALEQFLSHEFQQGAVRRMAKSMDAAASAVHAALLTRVAPAAEAAVLRLSELQARATQRPRAAQNPETAERCALKNAILNNLHSKTLHPKPLIYPNPSSPTPIMS